MARKYRSDITREWVLRFVEYDPRTGWFRSKATGYRISRRHPAGYIRLAIDNKDYLAHRIAWLIHYGELPAEDTDHINRVRWDNRIENLRAATPSQNGARRLSPRNKFGHRGIVKHPDPRRKKPYAAHLTVNRKCKTLGWYATAEEAAEAYRKAHDAARGEFSYFAGSPPK